MKNIGDKFNDVLFQPLELPCGVILKNRLIKSAMSDSLGDGRGNPTDAQARLYERWANGGVAALIIGEVQSTPDFAEKPGNLVLRADSDHSSFENLAQKGSVEETQFWLQLGHAGALAHPPISVPKGPSAIDVPGLKCEALTLEEIQALPEMFARTAKLAQNRGFGGVQIHSAHGFLLSQFLSPLFNQRDDGYGGSIAARMRLLLEVVEAVRGTVDSHFAVAVKLNATDQLAGGLEEQDALSVVAELNTAGIDLIEISGGTYFPGAKSASDSAAEGPYFINFASQARNLTSIPIMVTGGFKTRPQAHNAIFSGATELVGLARALVLDPNLVHKWRSKESTDPNFPRFQSPPEGGITAWYTMRLTQIGEDRESNNIPELETALKEYDERDSTRSKTWIDYFQ